MADDEHDDGAGDSGLAASEENVDTSQLVLPKIHLEPVKVDAGEEEEEALFKTYVAAATTPSRCTCMQGGCAAGNPPPPPPGAAVAAATPRAPRPSVPR